MCLDLEFQNSGKLQDVKLAYLKDWTSGLTFSNYKLDMDGHQNGIDDGSYMDLKVPAAIWFHKNDKVVAEVALDLTHGSLVDSLLTMDNFSGLPGLSEEHQSIQEDIWCNLRDALEQAMENTGEQLAIPEHDSISWRYADLCIHNPSHDGGHVGYCS